MYHIEVTDKRLNVQATYDVEDHRQARELTLGLVSENYRLVQETRLAHLNDLTKPIHACFIFVRRTSNMGITRTWVYPIMYSCAPEPYELAAPEYMRGEFHAYLFGLYSKGGGRDMHNNAMRTERRLGRALTMQEGRRIEDSYVGLHHTWANEPFTRRHTCACGRVVPEVNHGYEDDFYARYYSICDQCHEERQALIG